MTLGGAHIRTLCGEICHGISTFTWLLLQLNKELVLPEVSQGCVDKCIMLGWVPGVDENIMKIYDQPLVQQVLENGVGMQLSYYTGWMAWAFIHNVCTLYRALSSTDSHNGTVVRECRDLFFKYQGKCDTESGRDFSSFFHLIIFAPDFQGIYFLKCNLENSGFKLLRAGRINSAVKLATLFQSYKIYM